MAVILPFMLASCSQRSGYYGYLSDVRDGSTGIEDFYERAIGFWMSRVDTINEFSYKHNDTLRLFLDIQDSIRKNAGHDFSRFVDEIKRFEEYDSENSISGKPVLFIGSSTINLWKTAECFPEHNVLNRGFGGAAVKDILHYYDNVVGKYSPSAVIIYDDIEIENGDPAESVFREYKSLSDRIHNDFPDCRIIFISVKPVPMDFLLGRNVRSNKDRLNAILKDYAGGVQYVEYVDLSHLLYNPDGTLKLDLYSEDRMHFNESGYELWSKELNKIL